MTKLYTHQKHGHVPRNINTLHDLEAKAGGLNTKIAVFVTNLLGNMWCAYFFVFLAILGFPGFHATANQYVQWTSQTFIQLVALSILSVGQDVISRHQQLQAQEMFDTTQKSFHDVEQIVIHLDKQDEELLAQSDQLLKIITKLEEMSYLKEKNEKRRSERNV